MPLPEYFSHVEEELVAEAEKVENNSKELSQAIKDEARRMNQIISDELKTKRCMSSYHVMDYSKADYPGWTNHLDSLKQMYNLKPMEVRQKVVDNHMEAHKRWKNVYNEGPLLLEHEIKGFIEKTKEEYNEVFKAWKREGKSKDYLVGRFYVIVAHFIALEKVLSDEKFVRELNNSHF